MFVEDAGSPSTIWRSSRQWARRVGSPNHEPSRTRSRDTFPLKRLTPPATLDGGDVLRVGRRLFVGLSRRTNTAAVDQLARLLDPYDYEVIPVSVAGALHLKSACSSVGR